MVRVAKLHKMAKISILITLLLQLCVIRQGLSMCYEYYRNIAKPGTNEILGRITIPLPTDVSKDVGYYLKVGFKTNPLIHKNEPVARLEIVQRNGSLLYNVHFPLGQAIPRLTGIWFNNQLLCTNSEGTDNTLTTVEVKHVSQSNEDLLPSYDLTHQSSNTQTPPTLSTAHLTEDTDNNVFVSTTPVSKPSQSSTNNNNSNNNINNDNNNECGINYTNRTNPLIIYGEETRPGQWPWVVAVFAVRIDHEFKCVGSILTNKHIITAAHCLKLNFVSNDTVHPNVLVVALGRFNLRQWRETGTLNREVVNYKIHPDYEHTNSGDSDLAILTLRTPVEFSPLIKPICLWSGSTNLENIVNKTGWVVGWGQDESGRPYTENPRMSRVPIVSQETCLRSHWVFVAITSERTFCGGLRNGGGPCNGDSGTGLVLFNITTGRYQLRGVVSRSLSGTVPSCDLQNYIVYVDVAKYVPWIHEQISTT